MHRATKHTAKLLLALAATTLSCTSHATCWQAAAAEQNIPVEILKAVAKIESGFRANAYHLNADGSHDIGIMQINSSWLPTLAEFGITEAGLKDACTNIKVGAWILARNARRYGWNWEAIGANNVGCKHLTTQECARRRGKYAWKVHTALKTVAPFPSGSTTPPAESPQASDTTAPRTQTKAPRKIMLVRFDEGSVMEQNGVRNASAIDARNTEDLREN